MLKGDRKAKKHHDADGARMLSNEIMVSFKCVNFPVPVICDHLICY